MKTKLADWEGKTMRDKNQSRIGRTSAITLESKYRAARNSSLNAENVRVLLWGGKRIRTFRGRYDSFVAYRLNGIPLGIRRIAETTPVPGEIRTRSTACGNFILSPWGGRIRTLCVDRHFSKIHPLDSLFLPLASSNNSSITQPGNLSEGYDLGGDEMIFSTLVFMS
jgi:hypothetical protein